MRLLGDVDVDETQRWDARPVAVWSCLNGLVQMLCVRWPGHGGGSGTGCATVRWLLPLLATPAPRIFMHCVLTADLAAVISHHGRAILHRRESVPPEAMTQYWASTRNRFELWHRAMARYRNCEQTGDMNSLRQWWSEHVVVMEEVLVTEMLTRIVASLADGLERDSEHKEIAPIAHAIHLTHLEARNRVQQIMLYGRGNSVQDAVRLNRLRQGVERWTDALIGRMAVNENGSLRYAIDPNRAAEYAEEARALGVGPARDTAVWLMNAAMHDMLRRRTSPNAALPDANRSVIKSLMMMLRPDLFDSIGVLKSLWLHRLETGTERTDRVLDELTAPNIYRADTAQGMEILSEPYFERWYM